MHTSVMAWVKVRVKRHQLAGCSTLEIGSLDVNGSVREYFSGPYVGLDISAGPAVDVRASSWALPFATGTFDCVVSTEMLEHDLRPWRTISEATRVLVPGGHLLLTARGYDLRGCFQVHDYPGDYWRYSVDGLAALCNEGDALHVIRARSDPKYPGTFIHAKKV